MRLPRPISLTLALLAALACALPVRGQPSEPEGIQTWVNLTGSSVVRLRNAVRVTIETDGALQVQWVKSERLPGGVSEALRINILMPNARSKIGSFVYVGVYPISHLEITPTDAAALTGTGVRVTVVMYYPADLFGLFEPRELPQREDPPDRPQVYVNTRTDESGVIITALTDELVPPAPTTLTDAERAALHSSIAVQGDASAVSVTAVNARLADLIEQVDQVTGLAVTVTPGLPERVSAYLPSLPPQDAVAALADRLGLSLGRRGNELILGPPEVLEANGYAVAETQIVPLHYLTTTRAIVALPAVVLPYVRADDQRNALIVHAPPPLAEKIRSDLAVVDQPTPIIEVRAVMVERSVADDLLAALGIETAHLKIAPDTGEFTYRNLGGAVSFPALEARLAALRTATTEHLEQSATGRTQSGRGINLFEGVQQFITVVSGEEARVLPVEAGVNFRVGAYSGGTQIILHYNLSASDITDIDPVDRTPTVASRRVEGSINIQPGDTAMMGGLQRGSVAVTRHGLPGLRELPLIGGLFGSVRRRVEISELTIFFTATLLPATDRQTEPAK